MNNLGIDRSRGRNTLGIDSSRRRNTLDIDKSRRKRLGKTIDNKNFSQQLNILKNLNSPKTKLFFSELKQFVIKT